MTKIDYRRMSRGLGKASTGYLLDKKNVVRFGKHVTVQSNIFVEASHPVAHLLQMLFIFANRATGHLFGQ